MNKITPRLLYYTGRKQCTAKKKNGDRCQLYTFNNSDKCRVHLKFNFDNPIKPEICKGYKIDGSKCIKKVKYADFCGFHIKKINHI